MAASPAKQARNSRSSASSLIIVAGTVSHPQSRIRIGWHRPPWDVWRGIQLDSQAEALLDLAEVLRIKGQLPEATEQAERALDLYDRKGNLVSGRRVRRLLNELG
jgi:hypothetical protein